jgi:hypothetical protein
MEPLELSALTKYELIRLIRSLEQELLDSKNQIELLNNLWNVAYDYGVRVEIDSVTGEIYRCWMEKVK